MTKVAKSFGRMNEGRLPKKKMLFWGIGKDTTLPWDEEKIARSSESGSEINRCGRQLVQSVSRQAYEGVVLHRLPKGG